MIISWEDHERYFTGGPGKRLWWATPSPISDMVWMNSGNTYSINPQFLSFIIIALNNSGATIQLSNPITKKNMIRQSYHLPNLILRRVALPWSNSQCRMSCGMLSRGHGVPVFLGIGHNLSTPPVEFPGRIASNQTWRRGTSYSWFSQYVSVEILMSFGDHCAWRYWWR